MKTGLLLLLTLGALANARKLPPGLIPCSRNDPDEAACSLKNGQAAVKLVAKGFPAYGMVPLDPLHIDEISIDDSGSPRQVAINLTMKDLDLIGMKDTVMTKILMGHNLNNVVWEGTIPRLEIIGNYKISGRVLILPITGAGGMNYTLENLKFTYSFKYDREMRNDVEYVVPHSYKLNFVTTRCYIMMENLFNGDKRLSDQMNVFLNENWRELVEDLGPPIAESLNTALSQIVQTITKQVPYNDMHPDN